MNDSPSSSSRPEPDTYEEWTALGTRATREGRFPEALEAYEEALRAAGGDTRREDAAALNRAMALLQMGEARKGEEGLREILLRTTDAGIACSAAYHLASSLRRQGRFEQARRYAARAIEKAREARSVDRIAIVHNLLGNILLGQSHVDEARREYEEALRLRRAQDGDTRYSRAILEENLGYCLLLQKRFGDGLKRIRIALELAEQVGDLRCRAECYQDMCYGLLLLGRYAAARRWGERALESASGNGYADIEENAHYLLGEIGSRTEDLALRDRHFEVLQGRHPELPFLKDFLCAVDVTGILTLKR